MKDYKKVRSLNTTDFLKLCCLKLPEETKPILNKIIQRDLKIIELVKELRMRKDSWNILNEIENVRSDNNKNWMDLIRLAFTRAPEDATIIMNRIGEHDERVAELYKKLSETL